MKITSPSKCFTIVAGIFAIALYFCGLPVQAVNVLTQHNDNSRTGANTSETNLTTSNVNSNTFGVLFTNTVDGQVYAQPLYVQNLNISGGTHNVVFIATENSTVYAFDADASGTTYWTNHLGTSQSSGCGDTSPLVGITGTPVIDLTTGALYVDTRLSALSGGHKFHALNLTNGNEMFSGPVTVSATGFGTSQHQRPGLLDLSNVIYVAYGSQCDAGTYHGFVLGFSATNLSLLYTFNDTPNGSQAAIWGSGMGPVADASGNIYVMTGNGTFDGSTNNDFGETMIKLSSSLALVDWATPSTWSSLNGGDTDFGSGGSVLLPGGRIIGEGKDGIVRVANTTNMGHLNNWAQEFAGPNGGDVVGPSPVYWAGSGTNFIYYEHGNTSTYWYSYNGTTVNTTPLGSNSVTEGDRGGGISLSANGTNNGILWSLDTDGTVRAYNAQHFPTLLWSASVGAWQRQNCVTIANGKVYCPTPSGVIVFGLKNLPPSITTQPASRTNTAGQTATFTVVASGSPTLAYQWKVQSSGSYVNLSNAGQFSGVTTSTLTISNVATTNATNYEVVVTNSFGSVTSSAALLTVNSSNTPPTVSLLSPTNGATYTATASLSLTASASSSDSTITSVSFYTNSVLLGTVSNSPYALTTTGLGAASYGLKAVAIDGFGLSSTTATVNITINAGTGQPYGLASLAPAPAFYNMPTVIPGTLPGTLPTLLSGTGVFSNTASRLPTNGLIPYQPIVPLWSDGAVKTRYFSVPNTGGLLSPSEQIAFLPTNTWTFPSGTVFVKNFDMVVNTTNNTVRRLETRLLVRNTNGSVYGVTYAWRPDNSDADLLTTSSNLALTITNASGVTNQTWYFPSPTDCLTCHTAPANYVLGVNTRQLNSSYTYTNLTGNTDNQLRALNRIGLFYPAFDEASISNMEQLSALGDTNASLVQRSRSYLDANCAQCHQPGGTGITFDARYDTPLASQNISNYPASRSLLVDLEPAYIVEGNDTWRSMLLTRINTNNLAVQMPPLARNIIDTNAVSVISAWIGSMSGLTTLVPPTISPNGGGFTNSVSVTLASTNVGASIYYTLDGSLPTTNSSLYSSAITLTNSVTLTANCFKTGSTNSIAAQAAFASSGYQNVILGDSPLAFWPLNETTGTTIHDIAGTNNGTAINTNFLGYGGPGVTFTNNASDKAMYFTNTGNPYISVPYNAAFQTTNFSVELWLNMPTFPANAQSANENPVGFCDGLAALGWTFDIQVANASNPHMYGWVGKSGSWNSGDSGVALQSQWSYYVMTFNGSTLIVYTNGVQAASTAVTTYSMVTSGNYLYIGDYNDGGNTPDANRYFQGGIENVAVYNNALTVAKITNHYYAGTNISSGTAPSITSQPASTTNYATQTATFSVTASGTAPLAYQWKVLSSGSYVNLSNVGQYSGVTTVTLTISNLAATNATNYEVVVTNAFGSATSAAATLTVLPAAPSITTQPSSTTKSVGQTATFTVVAAGLPPLSYQWKVQSSGVYGNLANAGQFSGVTTATLTISNVALTNATNYEVVVTNTAGTVTSAAALLTVNASANYQSIILADAPVSYWPMQETTGPTISDIVTTNAGPFNGTLQISTDGFTNGATDGEGKSWGIIHETFTNSTSTAATDGLTYHFGGPGGLAGVTNDKAVYFTNLNGQLNNAQIAMGTGGTGAYEAQLDAATFTVEAWIKVPTYTIGWTSNAFQVPLGLNAYGNSGGTANGWFVGVNTDSSGSTAYGEMFFEAGTGTAYTSNGPSAQVFSGHWVYAVQEYNGTATVIYTNGTLMVSNAQTYKPLSNSATHELPFIIGSQTAYYFGGAVSSGSTRADFWDGGVSHVAYYNYALAASHITNHYYYGTNASFAGAFKAPVEPAFKPTIGATLTPALSSGSSANQFQMQVSAVPNQNYTLQICTDLSSGEWVSLYTTNSTTNTTFVLTDPNAATNKQRFYRVLIGP